jgi:hypothetical protein
VKCSLTTFGGAKPLLVLLDITAQDWSAKIVMVASGAIRGITATARKNILNREIENG